MKKIFTSIVLMVMAMTAMAQSLPEGFLPCAVSDLTGSWEQVEGKNNINISFVTPTQMSKYDSENWQYIYDDLTAITKIDVQRSAYDMYNYQTIYTFNAPALGAQLSYTDKDLAYGQYDYRIVVYVGDVCNDPWDWNAMKTFVAGQIPQSIPWGELTASASGNKVTLSFTAPELDTQDQPLTMPMTIKISEMDNSWPPQYTLLKTITNAVPGQQYNVEIENVSDGQHTFAVEPSTETGAAYESTVNILVGNDAPGEVSNVVATPTADGIVITWEAPTSGLNGGDMGDVNALTYSIYRKASAYDQGTLIAEGVSGLTYTDNYAPAEESTVLYDVVAFNATGNSYGTSSNTIVVGPASALPYTENFDTADQYGSCDFDHSTWVKSFSGNYCTWYNCSEYFNLDGTMVYPHNGNGMAYAMYSSWGSESQWDAITTGHIDFSTSQYPTVTLWVYDLAKGGSDVTLNIETTNDESTTFTNALAEQLGNASEEGWRQITAIIPAVKGCATAQVRLRSEISGYDRFPVVIDEILIDNNEEAYNTVGINNVNATTASTAVYNAMGQRVGASAKGFVIMNGKKFFVK